MPLMFKCSNCGSDIVVNFVGVGETATCKSCGNANVVPQTAVETTQDNYYYYRKHRVASGKESEPNASQIENIPIVQQDEQLGDNEENMEQLSDSKREELRKERKNENTHSNSPWLILAGGYAVLLSGAILIGTLVSMAGGERYPGNAVRMPLISALIALCLGTAGIGLFRRINLGRFVFLVVAPWGSIALGSVFAQALWQEDVPYTAMAIFAYVPLAFLLARGSALRAVGAKGGRWMNRGGGLVLACSAVMFLARLAIVASKPSGGGGFFGTVGGLNEYVKRLVLCDVPLWNYVIAFVVVSIPTRFTAKDTIQR